jgi:hypothetical protein
LTGADSIFFRASSDVPAAEKEIYQPLLADREMQRWTVPAKTMKYVFHPFEGHTKLGVEDVRKKFPKTWKNLKKHETELRTRKSVRLNPELWWRPVRPRSPKTLFQPKIVCPHLMLFPRFGLDERGTFAVSHSPFLILKDQIGGDLSVLRFFLAVLNSSVGHWQIATQSHKYSRGYARLEVATLKNFRVPSPATVPPRTMNRIQTLVDSLIQNPVDKDCEDELDRLVAEIYGIELSDLEEIPMGSAE